jgi:hypothetical protein
MPTRAEIDPIRRAIRPARVGMLEACRHLAHLEHAHLAESAALRIAPSAAM